MKVRIKGNVEHDGVKLEEDEVYDLEDKAAKALIKSGNAKEVDQKKTAQTYTPMKVKRDQSGVTIPGEKVEATEENANPSASVKAVEPKQDSVKGGEQSGK